jgi:F-type H+-transporting ATPase subunit b
MFSLFAAEAATQEGVFEVLGIDWKILVFQTIAFGLLIFILAKFIYPPIMKMLDRREKMIEDSVKAAKEAAQKSADAEIAIAKKIANAQAQAEEIVNNARVQASQLVADSEQDAKKRADNIVEAAQRQLQRDVESARELLRGETAGLVSLATEKVVGEKVDTQKDAALINEALKETGGRKKDAK